MGTLRFAPPEPRWTAELRWVLLRAFAPTDREAPRPHDPARAVQDAQSLGLAERIAVRTPDDVLVAELGRPIAARLALARARARARTASLLDAAAEATDCAATLGVAVVALKGAALHLGGHVPAGARPAGDVDLLVAPGGARALFERLRARGWTVEPIASADHQLPSLANQAGGVVELHTHVPGVRLPVGGPRFARLDTLEAAGLLEAGPAGRGRVAVPRREALVAHATAHAIAQHGFAPASYPLTRALADLCDLDLARADRATAWALVARDVTTGEVAAVESACRLLAAGAIGFLDDPDSPTRVLLAHAVAGAFDRAYRDRLRVSGLVHRLTEGSQLRALLGGVGRTLRSPRHGVSVALTVARALVRRG